MKQTLSVFLSVLFAAGVQANDLSIKTKQEIEMILDHEARKEVSVGKVKLDSVKVVDDHLLLYANANCSYIPFREENVQSIYEKIRHTLPSEMKKYELELWSNHRRIEDMIPSAHKSKKKGKDKLFQFSEEIPLIRQVDRTFTPRWGLSNRHIALWQSHGFYFEQKLDRWEWQRARIFQTVEDLFTQSYVLPYLVPMLEQAGANVLLPRERDCRVEEVIVDQDPTLSSRSIYREKEGAKLWKQGDGPGFAQIRDTYEGVANPFNEGVYRQVESVKRGDESVAEWLPDIPVDGEYGVYVSYKSVPKSVDDALYSVYHKGGVTRFKINQQMGGGTWIYLGQFAFDAGQRPEGRITLSNRSRKSGLIVTADAVKLGGGMGNIARKVSDEGPTENLKSSDGGTAQVQQSIVKINHSSQISGYPRFCEAARYWMQWAGVPDSIYTPSQGRNDYTDDYQCRGKWVNYLAGGSAVNPTQKGLNIPIDMALAFHTDAGTTRNDSIIGTLGIYCTEGDNGIFQNGASRHLSHDLTDLIQSSIVNDIRALYEPQWSRRGKWNKSYYEARVPRVPTMLLELLSHQNFADMRYGIDPRFRFTVSRSIYKGILKFLCSQNRQKYIVQPLPVDHMALQMTKPDEVELTWQPVNDPLEPTAVPTRYIVYTRIDDGVFDRGVLVDQNRYRATLPEGKVCSFKVTAVNEGGESFPSEILSAGRAVNSQGRVMIINGFDRISAPDDFVAPAPADTLLAGFLDDKDHGVPYLRDISYIGKMKEFRRSVPWMDDDASGFGDSYANYETQVIAGNSFDYPAVHGRSILQAGYSFVSCSDEAVEKQLIKLGDYWMVDLILGKEKQTKIGRGGVMPLEFKTFTSGMQEALTSYCHQGGNLLVTGAYVGTDLWDNPLAPSLESDRRFATEVLKYKWRVGQAAVRGAVRTVESPYEMIRGEYSFADQLNSEIYVVESPDAIEPASSDASTIMRYSENNLSSGVAYSGAYRTCVLGFPFETITTAKQRDALMTTLLLFFSSPKK